MQLLLSVSLELPSQKVNHCWRLAGVEVTKRHFYDSNGQLGNDLDEF